MRDWLLERFLGRGLDGGERLPRWVRALLDETFLWVAVGQLLLALGVSRLSVRRLSVVQATLGEAREVFGRAGYEIPRLEGIETDRDLERFGVAMSRFESRDFAEEELNAILPAPRAVRWARDAGTVVLDLLEETLGRLQTLRIRTELIGIDHRAALSSIVALREVLARSDLDTAAAVGYVALVRRLEALEGEGLFTASGLETRPRAPSLGEVGRIVGVIRSLPRGTLDRLLPLRLLSSRLVLTAAITKGLKQHRNDWVPSGERPEHVEDEEVTRHQDFQRWWRRAHVQFFREVDEHDALPGTRRALIAWTATLWGLSLVVVGWILLWILGAGGIDLPGILGRPVEIPPLWPGPTVLVLLAVLPLSYATARFAPIDQAQLVQPRLHAVADATPARRARVLAARCGAVIADLLFFLPFLVAILIDPKDTFPWESFGPWRNERRGVGWWAVWSLALPAMAMIASGLMGGRHGESRARTLRPVSPESGALPATGPGTVLAPGSMSDAAPEVTPVPRPGSTNF